MERYNKILNREQKINTDIDFYKIQGDRDYKKIQKKKTKNLKYSRQNKFRQNFSNLDNYLCNCKWAKKYNFHEEECKFKSTTITNKNVVNQEKLKYKNVLFNQDLLLIILENVAITDLYNILVSCKTLHNLIKINISSIINNLTTKYTINQHFIILVIASREYHYDLDLSLFYKCYSELMYSKRCSHRQYFYKYYKNGEKKLKMTQITTKTLKHCNRYKRGILDQDSYKEKKCNILSKFLSNYSMFKSSFSNPLEKLKLKVCYCQKSNFNYNYTLLIKRCVRLQINDKERELYKDLNDYKGKFNIYNYYTKSNYSDFDQNERYDIYDPDGPYLNGIY